MAGVQFGETVHMGNATQHMLSGKATKGAMHGHQPMKRF